MKCDTCDNEATIHITEIRRGLSYDRHLCERCAEMFLPLEESDYADYLDALPPRYSTHLGDEPLPTADELEMTGLVQQVILVDLETGEARHTGPERGDAFSPVWSPDASRLALCHSVETLQSVVLVEPDGPWRRQFLRTSFAEAPSWSPDSCRIAFSHPDDGTRIVLAADVAGGGLHRLSTVSCLDEFMPVWSPVDDRIAFLSRPVEGTDEEKSCCSVFVSTLDTERRRRVITLEARLAARHDWSPDGRLLAVLGVPVLDEELPDILSAAEGSLHVVSSASEDAADTALPVTCTGFAWAARAAGMPGPALLASVPTDDGETRSVLLIDPESREIRTVVDEVFFPAGEVHATHLSPDGKTLVALRGEHEDHIVFTDVSAGTETVIRPRGEVAWVGWHPNGDEVLALIRIGRGVRMERITPEGRRREVATFGRETFYDVPGMAVSGDGRFAAVEVHAVRRD
ncbi:MAG TPA: hypothetical protein VMZ92_13670 [Planctomycetota bacterium]|nr:hypothetical protein [Planctomycetota bacterium]